MVELNENANSKKPLFPVNANSKQSIIIFCVAIVLIVGITFLAWITKLINLYAIRLCFNLLLIVAYTAVAAVAMFLTAQQKNYCLQKANCGCKC